MVTQLCEYKKIPFNYALKWMKCMVCELYLNKTYALSFSKNRIGTKEVARGKEWVG